MPQLVGLPCSMCEARIGNTLDAGFCAGCRNPVHHRCRAPADPAVPRACEACGTDLDLARRRAEETERQRQAEAARRPPPPLDIVRYRRYYANVRFLLIAPMFIALGVSFIEANEPGSTFAGIAAIVGGSVFAAIGFSAFRAKRQASSDRR